MMRRPLTTLLLAATCGVLVLGAGLAVAIKAGAGARGGRDAQVSHWRRWPARMSAAPDDLALAEATFREPARGRRISSSSLRVSVGSPFGDDYLAAAALQLPTRGVLRVLVVLVNRPSPLLDPVSVSVGLAAPWGLGAPIVRESADPLSRPAGARAPALCDLALHGAALGASELRTLRTRGQALVGFNAANALAQAYDLVCGLPYSSAFKQALTSSAVPVSPAPPESHPPPSPVPSPPVGKIPGEGCVPTPGYACPGASRADRERPFSQARDVRPRAPIRVCPPGTATEHVRCGTGWAPRWAPARSSIRCCDSIHSPATGDPRPT